MAEKPLLRVLAGQTLDPPPVWFMRQAGRYLAEYRALRAQAGSFLDLCYAPALAAEVTLQPIRRFGFDAAILFSDILVVPHALGQELTFVEGEGPRLPPITDEAGLAELRTTLDENRAGRVYETVSRVKADLPPGVALIGFCGAPWTVSTYMVGGGVDRGAAALWARRDPKGFGRLIERIEDASVEYLSGQAAAGAEALQLFDSWAGELAPDLFHELSIAPMRRMTARLKARHPGIPVIAFPRGAGSQMAAVAGIGADAIGIDTAEDPAAVRKVLGASAVLQGNLDPLALIAGGEGLDRAVDAVLDGMAGGPFVFNLGHGIRQETPIASVERALARIRRTAR